HGEHFSIRFDGEELSRAAHLEALNEIARTATLDLELRPMLQRITDALQRGFGWEFVACIVVDAARGRFSAEALSADVATGLRAGISRPLGQGVVGMVARSGESMVLHDACTSGVHGGLMPGARSILCVPVRHRGEVVALLNLESGDPDAFQEQLPVLETVAEQVAGAIASARLHKQVAHRARLLEMVSEVSKAALEAGELKLLLDRVVKYIRQRFDLAVVSILLTEGRRRAFREIAHAGYGDLSGERWTVAEGVVGRAIRTREPQLVLDVEADPDFVCMRPGVVAEFAVPICFRKRLLGVLNLESESREVFTPDNQVAFRTFADQLAGTIHLATVNRELEVANERLRVANARLERLSWQDGLTEVANRRRFDEVLATEWRRAQRASTPLSLVMLDIDSFKAFNDGYGHRSGDESLRAVARALAASLRDAGDFVGRYGGEEFVILLPEMGCAPAAELAELLRSRVEALTIPHRWAPAGVLTASLGVATSTPSPALPSTELVDRADGALYAAKRAGGNRVSIG
ncbi:MAG TPA: diguanylate cyclase, partial [Longimicrobium sp.]|nr:diguanylate cyclase [Longimicrobium sp.]